VTDARGTFDLCLPARAAKLRVEADGYGPFTRVIDARGAERQDVTLMPEASLEGNVVGPSGAVPWAIVSLRASGDLVRDVRADGEGRFSMPRLAPGVYAIEARGPGAKSKAPVEVSVLASSRASVTVAVESRREVRGHVVSAGGPVARASINVGFSATFEWGTAVRTADDGAFAIDDAPAGNLLVKVDDYEVESPRTLLVPDQGVPSVTVRVASKGELAVTVTRRGKPVSNAMVSVRGALASDTRTSNAEGVATFKGLSDPTVRVLAEHENDFAVAERVPIARDTANATALDLAAGRQVEGRVVDERGDPVDGARVSFTNATSTEDLGASATTNADGTFRGGPLRGPATYRAKVTRSGALLEPKVDFPPLVVPAAGSVSPSNLVLVVRAQDKELRGVVVDAAGGPVRDARVVVTRTERHAPALVTTFTGNDGTFSARGLGGGPYTVKATAPSAAEAEITPVSLPSAPLRLVTPSVSRIEGSLRGFARTPSVMAWSVAGTTGIFTSRASTARASRSTASRAGVTTWAASTSEASAQTTLDNRWGRAGPDRARRVRHEDDPRPRARLSRGRTAAELELSGGAVRRGRAQPRGRAGQRLHGQRRRARARAGPGGDLYVWCNGDSSYRGGVVRMPQAIGEGPVTLWGLDVRGKPALDVKALGMTLADDHPFSRLVTSVDPKGAADRSGVRAGDVIDEVGGRSVAECGNGLVRAWLALLLTENKSVPVVVSRAGAPARLAFKLDHGP
jgi:hypothetical protein